MTACDHSTIEIKTLATVSHNRTDNKKAIASQSTFKSPYSSPSMISWTFVIKSTSGFWFKHARHLWLHMLCAAAPAPPTGVTAVQEGPTSLTVSWTQSGTVTEYWIYYVSAGGEDSGSAGLITSTSYTLHNLLDGLIYTITVIAVGEHLPSQSTVVQICKLKNNTSTLLLFCLQPFFLQAI